MEDFPSTFLEKFEVVEGLSSRRGTVFKALEKALNRVVAVKFFSPGLFDGEEALSRFIKEGRLLAKMKHTNLVDVYDVEPDPERPFIVMEYVDGFSLKDEIGRMGKIPLRHACSYMMQVAEGLAFIHKEGLVHRNLKPKNIIIDRFGVVKILDFGFALSQGGSAVDGGKGRVLGTPAYMSPEQAMGGTLNNSSDVYSAGVIFFEMLCGTVPFWGDTPKEIMRAHVEEEAPSIREFNPLVPRDVRAIVRRMLSKDLEERYDKIDKVTRDIKRFLARDDWEEEVEEARRQLEKEGKGSGEGGVDEARQARAKVKKRAAKRKEARQRRRKARKRRRFVETVRTLTVGAALLASLIVAAFGVMRMGNWGYISLGALGFGEQPKELAVRQVGPFVEVRWKSDTAGPSRIRMLAPHKGRIYENKAQLSVTTHALRIEEDFLDGARLRLQVLMPSGSPSVEFSHEYHREEIITKLEPEPGITEVSVTVETKRPTRAALEVFVKGKENGRKWSCESDSEAKVHHLSLTGIPALSEMEGQVSVRWSEQFVAGGRHDTVYEKKTISFKTGEPTYRKIFSAPQGDVIHPSPAIADGNVYIGCDDGKVYCLAEKTGRVIWQRDIGAQVRGKPIVTGDRVYVASRKGTILSLQSKDGAPKWTHDCKSLVEGGPILFKDSLYVATEAGSIHRILLDSGKEKWKTTGASQIISAPAIDGERVFIGDIGGLFLAYSLADGKKLWQFRTGNKLVARPAISGNYVLVPGMDDHLYALSRKSGIVSWRKSLGSIPGGMTVIEGVATGPNSKPRSLLYAALTKKEESLLLCANSRSGATMWTTPLPTTVQGEPAVAEGRVYIGGTDGKIYCFNADDGTRLWSMNTGSEIRGGPAASGTAVFVANYHGSLYRIED